jgi:hypothetical protein
MSGYKTTNEHATGMHTLPLILPMHRSLTCVVDSDSPWVSTDPVLLRECVAAYRSVRLILLALIAFISGPRRIQAEGANSEPPGHVAVAHLQTNRAKNLNLRQQASSLYREVQTQRAPFRSPVPPATAEININSGAWALALDSPRLQSLSREAARAHAPPCTPVLTTFNAFNSNRSDTILLPVIHRALSSLSACHPPQIFAHSIAHSASTRSDCAVALPPDLPASKSLHLEVIRAHAPPNSGPFLNLSAALFQFSNATCTHLNPFAPVTNPVSNLALSISRLAHSYRPQVLQSSLLHSPTFCQCYLAEGSDLPSISPPVSTQPSQLKGEHPYVCQ